MVGIDGTDARVSLDKKDNDVSDKERQREIGQQKEGRDSNADATHATKIRLASRLADYGRRREKDSAGANKGKLEKRKKTKKKIQGTTEYVKCSRRLCCTSRRAHLLRTVSTGYLLERDDVGRGKLRRKSFNQRPVDAKCTMNQKKTRNKGG